MINFFEVTSFIGIIIRLIGMLVFGVAVGWFTMFTFRQPERKWQLQIAVVLGFLSFSALALRFVSAGSAGAYAIGAGAALLFWGMKGEAKEDEADSEED